MYCQGWEINFDAKLKLFCDDNYCIHQKNILRGELKMVLPAKNSNHCFNVSGADELQGRIKLWIREHYSNVLGKEIHLLDQPNGIDLVEQKLKRIMANRGMIGTNAEAAVA